MKYLLTLFIMGCLSVNLQAQQLRTPSPSTTQTIKQEFGLGSVELSYSRPNMKGRKIFGDLVPYGKVWRTGANGATTLLFSDSVTIGGVKIAGGKYGLLSIPDADSWTLIITKQLDVTSPAAYKQSEDVVRVKATPKPISENIETFTMQFTDVKANSLSLALRWANTMVSLPITIDVNSKILAQIDNLMNKDNRPYFNAAMYYMDNGKDLTQALAWFNKALEQNGNPFYMIYQKAVCLSKLGRKDEAKATATQGIAAAKEAKNDDYVTLNEKLILSLK